LEDQPVSGRLARLDWRSHGAKARRFVRRKRHRSVLTVVALISEIRAAEQAAERTLLEWFLEKRFRFTVFQGLR